MAGYDRNHVGVSTDPPKQQQVSVIPISSTQRLGSSTDPVPLHTCKPVETASDSTSQQSVLLVDFNEVLGNNVKQGKASGNLSLNRLDHIFAQPSAEPRIPQSLSPEKSVSQSNS